MSRQVWKGSTLLNPEPPVLVSCGSPDHPNFNHGRLVRHHLHPAAHALYQRASRAL